MSLMNRAFALFKHQTFLRAFLLLLIAALLRFQVFSNPVFYTDEDFYLYTGGQLLEGYLPYVDIWDRKPFGLFLLYAPFYLFGEYRFWAYQIAALGFAWGTALFIQKITLKFAPARVAFFAGCLYLSLLGCLGGAGGQTPVFYNFLTAWAFCLALQTFANANFSAKNLTLTGMGAMFLIGMGIEIKPTVIFEGIFLGCFLLFESWRAEKNLKSLSLNSVLWGVSALFPTLCIAVFYKMIGHFEEWYFANIVSIFHKAPYAPLNRIYPYLSFSAFFLVSLIVLRYTAFPKLRTRARKYFYFILCWSLTAFAAACLIRPFYSFYLLPLCLPFALFAGLSASQNKKAALFLALGAFSTGLVSQIVVRQCAVRHSQKDYFDIQAYVEKRPNACLFEYGASVTMLDLTPEMAKNCHLTKYVFPGHLGNPDETGALGLQSEFLELQHILQQKPAFILVGDSYLNQALYQNYDSDKLTLIHQKNDYLKQAIKTQYHLIYSHPKDEKLELYELNKTF